MKSSKVTIITSDDAITRRVQRVVEALIQDGHTHDDIARFTGCNVTDLLEGAPQHLNRSHFTAFATHFGVSRLWLWAEIGPMFLNESKLPRNVRIA